MSTAVYDARHHVARGGSLSLLADAEYRNFWLSSSAWVFASRALAVVIGFQLYALTKNPLMLGWLGLVEAIPALSLVLYGGHYADRHDRRFTIIWSRGWMVLVSIGLLAVSMGNDASTVPLLLLLSFLAAWGAVHRLHVCRCCTAPRFWRSGATMRIRRSACWSRRWRCLARSEIWRAWR